MRLWPVLGTERQRAAFFGIDATRCNGREAWASRVACASVRNVEINRGERVVGHGTSLAFGAPWK